MTVRSTVFYKPAPDPSPRRQRYLVGGRLAWLYPEGTIVMTRDGTQTWECTHDHEHDSFPWWGLR